MQSRCFSIRLVRQYHAQFPGAREYIALDELGETGKQVLQGRIE
jgi:hypothetical protein